jgi:hypothetical protein
VALQHSKNKLNNKKLRRVMFNRYVVVGWVLKEKLKEVVSHEILHEKAPNKYYKLIKSYRNFNYRITKIIL